MFTIIKFIPFVTGKLFGGKPPNNIFLEVTSMKTETKLTIATVSIWIIALIMFYVGFLPISSIILLSASTGFITSEFICYNLMKLPNKPYSIYIIANSYAVQCTILMAVTMLYIVFSSISWHVNFLFWGTFGIMFFINILSNNSCKFPTINN